MYKFVLSCFLFFAPFWLLAQSSPNVTGQVTDSGKPVFAATIALINTADSTVIKAAITDSAGRFTIQILQPGNYRVRVTCLGYQTYMGRLVSITQIDLDLGQIALARGKARQLSTVTITGKKPFVEHKIDRTVINVDALATNQGISAADVLEKSPGIIIDPVNGNISLEGKPGVVVYIDDKKSSLTGNDLVAYLQSLPSGTLQQIELMTDPPARYDAAGGAVINIRLKKNVIKGFNGSYTQLYGHWLYGKVEERFNFDYRSGKFNLAGNFDDNQQNWANSNYQNRQYLDPDGSPQSYYGLNNFTHGKGYSLYPQLSLDYYATDKTTWGITIGDVYRPLTTLGETTSSFADQTGRPDSSVNQSFNNFRIVRDLWGNLNYRHQFDKNGHELTADFDYSLFNIGNNQLFNSLTTLPDQTITNQSQETGSTPSAIDIYAFKTDYSRPLKNGLKLEMGIKTGFTHTDNPAAYFNTVNDITEADYTKTNHFIYDENINAVYINASKDWKRFSAELGLRVENTNTKGDQLGNAIERDSSFTNHYTDLFPTLYLRYKLDSANVNQFGFNYGRRINRPTYQWLNPFIIPEDKFNYDVGNPYLNPSYNQNLELSYTYKNNLTVKAFYRKTTGDIEVINRVENGIIYSTYGNVGYQDARGISVSGSLNPAKWFSLNGYADFRYEHAQGLLNNNLVNAWWNVAFLNGNMQFKLGNGWNTELNGFYQSRETNLQYHQKGAGRLNVVLQKKISDNFLARLVVTDPLNTFRYEGSFNNLTLTNATYKNTFDDRGFNISITYRFGKAIKDLRQHRSDASSDEQDRVKN
ncbi:MAG TPA: TonB-dependent receptor [Mucilaginibacter sp.]|jgi:hypothetical protein|nr:TonB-dependent receptor [Mucilaginibacter sp.]